MWVTDEKGTRYVDDEEYAALVQARNDLLFDSINKTPGGQAAIRAEVAQRDADAKAAGTMVVPDPLKPGEYKVVGWNADMNTTPSAPQNHWGNYVRPTPTLAPSGGAPTPLPNQWRPRGRVSNVRPRSTLFGWRPRKP